MGAFINQRELYVAQLEIEKGIRLYKEPVMVTSSVSTVSNSYVLNNVGATNNDVKKLIFDDEQRELIHEGDRIYLNVPIPKELDRMAIGADYTVIKVLEYLGHNCVYIESVSPSGK